MSTAVNSEKDLPQLPVETLPSPPPETQLESEENDSDTSSEGTPPPPKMINATQIKTLTQLFKEGVLKAAATTRHKPNRNLLDRVAFMFVDKFELC